MKLSTEAVGITFLLLAWVAALLISPIIAAIFGLWWGVLAAVSVFFLWASVLPTTCMNGGLGFSLLAIPLFMNIIGMSIVAVIELIRSVTE